MILTKAVAATMMVGAIGFGGAAIGVPAASASPMAPAPLKPGHLDDDCFPFCDGGPGRDFDRGHRNDDRGYRNDDRGHRNDDRDGWDNDRGRWDNDRGHWDDKGPWWANNRHDWWDDRNGPPPWGWGPPPPVQWRGGHLPPSINYWGYNLNPVWDNGFRQWGVWLFGVWVPILGVGFG